MDDRLERLNYILILYRVAYPFFKSRATRLPQRLRAPIFTELSQNCLYTTRIKVL